MRHNKLAVSVWLWTAAFGFGLTSRAEGVTIAENGRGRAIVVVAEDAPEAEKHAANELARFLTQVTGWGFQVVGRAEGA